MTRMCFAGFAFGADSDGFDIVVIDARNALSVGLFGSSAQGKRASGIARRCHCSVRKLQSSLVSLSVVIATGASPTALNLAGRGGASVVRRAWPFVAAAAIGHLIDAYGLGRALTEPRAGLQSSGCG
jgi:hypothetical protein